MVNEEFIAAKDLIMSKEKILLLTHQKLDADGLSSMLAMWIILSRLWKDVKILSTDKIPETFEFLPHINRVTVSDDASRDFVISIKKSNWLEIDKLRYSTDDKYLNIVISPKKWEISEDNIAYSRWIGEYDLIIIVDTWDLDHLWNIYKDNVELFYNTPIVNIDHHVTNTWFWQVNLVDTTASSSTVIVYDLIKHFSKNWKEIIDEDIATLLMTWLITDTWSFRHNNTTPRALEIAADLMEFWARQQEIIKNIYKTKHLSTLQMWWRVLSKIKEDPIHRLVWSTVTTDDLKETWANIDDSEWIIDELLSNAPWAEIICLFKHWFDWVLIVSIRTSSIAINWSLIAKHFWWWGHRQASWFKIKWVSNFDLEVSKIIEYIQDFQKDRLWIIPGDLEGLEVKDWTNDKIVSLEKKQLQQWELTETWVEFPKSASVIGLKHTKEKKWITWVFEIDNNKVSTEWKNDILNSDIEWEDQNKSTWDNDQDDEWGLDFVKAIKELKEKKDKKDKEEKNDNKAIKVNDKKNETVNEKREDISESQIDFKQLNKSKKEDKSDVSNVEDQELIKQEEIDVNQEEEVVKQEDAIVKQEEEVVKQEDAIVKQEEEVVKQEDAIDQKEDPQVTNPENQAVELDETVNPPATQQEDNIITWDISDSNVQDAIKWTEANAVSSAQNIKNESITESNVNDSNLQSIGWQVINQQTSESLNEPLQVNNNQIPQVDAWVKISENLNSVTSESSVDLQNSWPNSKSQASQSSVSENNAQSWAWLVSKQEADRYARRFYELLQTTKPWTEEYKKYYEWYMYYAKVAWWQV